MQVNYSGLLFLLPEDDALLWKAIAWRASGNNPMRRASPVQADSYLGSKLGMHITTVNSFPVMGIFIEISIVIG